MKRSVFAYPYVVWMAVFIVVPMLLIVYYTFTSPGQNALTLENLRHFFTPTYMTVLARSLYLAFLCTVICLLLGYPLAMILSSRNFKGAGAVLVLVVVPMWMNFLLRTYAWVVLLENGSFLSGVFEFIGLKPPQLLYTQQAVLLGMVYNFLPFMVLPVYSVLQKMDRSFLEAASDLGARPLQVFFRVTFPLSLPGVASGITMVFMPAASTFVISRLLGGGKTVLFGDLIENQFLLVNNWHFGSALSVVLLALILVSTAVLNSFGGNNKMEGGGLL